MSEARFSVVMAGPLVTFQDAGRPGHMRHGVPASGPMDRLAFAAAHAALGNPPGGTAIEVSPGGLALRCTQGAVTLAVTGADVVVDHDGQKSASWIILTIRAGETLKITAGKSGNWAYVAFAGKLLANRWLDSTATHAASGFGGGALKGGDNVSVTAAEIRTEREGMIPRPAFPDDGPVRVVIGPQDRHFAPEAQQRFLAEPFKVSDAHDRMGMRLIGSSLALRGALSIPSEPILRGSVQVAGDGVPTVLLADHQTTGGYPKIATVIACDVDRLAQHRTGETLRFRAVTGAEAIAATRGHAALTADYLARIAIPRGTLEERLMRENLIHGCIFD